MSFWSESMIAFERVRLLYILERYSGRDLSGEWTNGGGSTGEMYEDGAHRRWAGTS